MELSRRSFLKGGGALVVGFGLAGRARAAVDPYASGGPVDLGQVDSFLAIHADNTATVKTGRVELGQGSTTGLLLLVAEELDMDVDQLVTARHDTNVTPNTGGTFGSQLDRDRRAAAAQRGGDRPAGAARARVGTARRAGRGADRRARRRHGRRPLGDATASSSATGCSTWRWPRRASAPASRRRSRSRRTASSAARARRASTSRPRSTARTPTSRACACPGCCTAGSCGRAGRARTARAPRPGSCRSTSARSAASATHASCAAATSSASSPRTSTTRSRPRRG